MKTWLLLFISISAFSLSVVNWLRTNEDVSKQEIVAGVLRSEDDQGWYVINDKGHTPINVQSVKAEGGLIVITYSKEFESIHSFIAVPDETFAKAGLHIGASVGRSKAKILVSKYIEGKVVPIDASKIRSKWGNIWIYGLFDKGKN
jgi:hypothetical protein